MENNIEISIDKDKEPYIKKITEDKIINLTGESGSGKSYYTNKYKNKEDYIIIDTDEVFSRFEQSEGVNKEFGTYIREKYKENIPSLYYDFDIIYDEILRYFSNTEKTIIIDTAQFRNMKDVSKIKGTIIIMRTSVNKCYNRCIERYNRNHPNATEQEKTKYAEKKKGMYSWYKSLNNFIIKVDEI